ncbi:MAG: hypothetical protein QNJ55_05045 [Xenococcus sp. MO_188.B8]|nr:hypothetical protein [Xenococcus sp. MO_188.B8]
MLRGVAQNKNNQVMAIADSYSEMRSPLGKSVSTDQNLYLYNKTLQKSSV